MPAVLPSPELLGGLEFIAKTCLLGQVMAKHCDCYAPQLYQRIYDTVDRLYAILTQAAHVPVNPEDAN